MLLSSLLSILAPHECLGCGVEGPLVCTSCQSALIPAVPRCFSCHKFDADSRTCRACRSQTALYAVHAGVCYEGIAKDLIWKLKFGRAHSAADEVGALLAFRTGGYGAQRVIVTHVPTAAGRIRQRGYDQSAKIAKAYARTQALPYAPLLARDGHHKQVGAARAVRLSQLANAFRAVRYRNIIGAHVILIDDVVTTGATLQAASRVLKEAGAKRVEAIVFAQA